MENNQVQESSVMKTSDWFITILITAIPLVGIIMLFVWAFSSDTNVNKANWAKAYLLWIVVAIVLSFLVFLIFGATLFSLSDM